jgi:stage V sporulation protein D (sporulation-specific penicillin-binding protein)
MRKRYSTPIWINKINFLIVGSIFVAIVIILRLFQLQVLEHDHYQAIAARAQYGVMELPAQRGEVIIKDYHSDEEFLLGTNITLNLAYADPAIIKNPIFVGEKIAPLLFDLKEERLKENERIDEASRKLSPDLTEEDIKEILREKTDLELEEEFRAKLIESISARQRPQILLATDLSNETLAQVQATGLSGIEIIDDDVYAYPPQIISQKATAEILAPLIEFPTKKLETVLKGENRYVVLKRKLDPNVSDQIREMFNEDEENFAGIGLTEEYFRYYPEGSLASNIVGYVDHANIGQYGIESSFNSKLKGQAGQLQTKRDSIGRQITVGESVLNPAVNGDNIVLTIDRSIQLQTERILAEAVQEYQADSGQVLIMNPQTGAIIAMANYPTFDPNSFGDVYAKVETSFTEEEMKSLYPSNQENIYYFYKNPITLSKYMVFEEKSENEDEASKYYRYENFFGPEAYHNKIISWPYEPGSVFKPVTMAIAIDDGDVTPQTTYNDAGPVGVDLNAYTGEYDFEIKNADGYFGLVNMNTVLAESLNTGMTFVAKKIGSALFYSYLKKFGFLDRTDIEFDVENIGKIEYFEDWTESELATHAFGQGMTVTMIQLANAYSSLANGGVLMQPHIVDEIRHDNDRKTETDPHEIRRVISEETSSIITTMLVNATENGVANKAQVQGHFIAGKTGTSQTYKHGKALSGSGTTITSFAGYGPIDDPKFVVIVKFDHPRQSEWGADTAAPTFSKIAEYLFSYYSVPPDK